MKSEQQLRNKDVKFITFTYSSVYQVRAMYYFKNEKSPVYVAAVDIGNLFDLSPRNLRYYVKAYCNPHAEKRWVPSSSGYQQTLIISNKDVSKLVKVLSKRKEWNGFDEKKVEWLKGYNLCYLDNKKINKYFENPFIRYKSEISQATQATQALISDNVEYFKSLGEGKHFEIEISDVYTVRGSDGENHVVNLERASENFLYFKNIDAIAYRSTSSKYDDDCFERYVCSALNNVKLNNGNNTYTNIIKLPRVVTYDYVESLVVGSLLQGVHVPVKVDKNGRVVDR